MMVATLRNYPSPINILIPLLTTVKYFNTGVTVICNS